MTEPNLRRRLNLRQRLPPEIVEEILCNLPVKSLNRFRCVSSDWQSLISDNHFIRKHLTASQRTRFIVNDIKTEHLPWFPLSSSDFIENEYADAYDLLSISSVLNMSVPWVLASCDGMLCFSVSGQIYILNPCMKTFRQIDDCSSYNSFAFGYDSIRDDYKLIKISINGNISSDRVETWVYSLKNSSWIRADDFPTPEFFPRPLFTHEPRCYTFLNGRIYWLAFCSPRKKFAFFIFDLSENKYVIINIFSNLPIWECFPEDVKLSALRGMLSACFHNEETNCLDLWVMKDCTDQNSWTRILRVPFQLVFCKYGGTPRYFEALYLYENGEVLVGVVSRRRNVGIETLLCKHSRILSRKIIYRNPCYIIQVGFPHVESLISP